MLTFNEAALEETAKELLQAIPEFLAVPRKIKDIPTDWTKEHRAEFDAFWGSQKHLPQKQREPRTMPLEAAHKLHPINHERALEVLKQMIEGVYRKTQVQQLCYDIGRQAYPSYSKLPNVTAQKTMAVGACLFRVLDEHCYKGWGREKDLSYSQDDIAGYTKTWITAPDSYLDRLCENSGATLKGFYRPGEVPSWGLENARENQFIRTNSAEKDWVLKHLSDGISARQAMEAANVNQEAQYLFHHENYEDWYVSAMQEELSPIAKRQIMTARERIVHLDTPVSFKYTADSRLRLYATDIMSPQAGKTRSYFWTPCDSEGRELPTQMLDNTGSGFQLMSCISRDELAAKYSNLLPNEGEPYDIHTEISREALKHLPTNHPVSLLNLKTRDNKTLKKLSKTASMATLYGGGVTHYSSGVIDYLNDELPALNATQKRAIDQAFEKALDRLFPDLRASYKWMLDALNIAVPQCPNLTITIGYDHQFRTKKRKEVFTKIETKNIGGFIGQLGGKVSYVENELDPKATARSYQAGIIQGMDACLMAMTLRNFRKFAEHQGFRRYISTTHDSYRISDDEVAAHWLKECNRRSLRVMFKDIDVLERLYQELKAQLLCVDLPPPPKRGTLDIEQVSLADHILTPEPMERSPITAKEYYEAIGF